MQLMRISSVCKIFITTKQSSYEKKKIDKLVPRLVEIVHTNTESVKN